MGTLKRVTKSNLPEDNEETYRKALSDMTTKTFAKFAGFQLKDNKYSLLDSRNKCAKCLCRLPYGRRRLVEVPVLPWEQKPAPIVRRLAAIPIDFGPPQS